MVYSALAWSAAARRLEAVEPPWVKKREKTGWMKERKMI